MFGPNEYALLVGLIAIYRVFFGHLLVNMNRYIYLLLASLAVFFPATASAEDYYWQP